MNTSSMISHIMQTSTPTPSLPFHRQELIEKLRTIPNEIKQSPTPGFLKDKYLHREIRTCPSWARKNLCRYGSKCVKAHYYFPTIVWRAHRVGQRSSECREWRAQQDAIWRRKREIDEGDHSDQLLDAIGSPSDHIHATLPNDLINQIPGCSFSDEVCGYAHDSENSKVVRDRVDLMKKMGSLPYRAVAMLECKTCGVMFRQMEDVLRHGRSSGHFQDSSSTNAKAQKWEKLERQWR